MGYTSPETVEKLLKKTPPHVMISYQYVYVYKANVDILEIQFWSLNLSHFLTKISICVRMDLRKKNI